MTIEILSQDTFLYVLSFLDDPKDLARASQVSKRWKLLCEEESLWKKFFPQGYAKDVSFRPIFQQKKVIPYGTKILMLFYDFLNDFHNKHAEFICEFPFQPTLLIKIKIENQSKKEIPFTTEKIYCLKKFTQEELKTLEITEIPVMVRNINANFYFAVTRDLKPADFLTVPS